MKGDGPINRVFVTGSTGLLGNNLVRQLTERGFEVVALVRSVEKAQRLIGDTGAEIVVGDMLRVDEMADAVDGCDAVVHTAAYFREYFQPGDHEDSLEAVNIDGTLKLMRLADQKGVSRFVHIGSAGIIGTEPDGSPGNEDTPPGSISLRNKYFRSKLEGAGRIREWEPQSRMAVIEILPGWMWGPGDAGPTTAGQLAIDFTLGKVPAIPYGGTSTVDARDVAKAVISALSKGKHRDRYIVGGPYMSLEEILGHLERTTGVSAPRRKPPYAVLWLYALLSEVRGRLTGRPVTVTRIGLDTMRSHRGVVSTRAERELGVTFRPFSETARDVVRWYADNGWLTRVAPVSTS